MERFLQKEQVLLGTRRSFGSQKNPIRNSSDVDFNDVFGGPPRRSSLQDWRHSLGESTDSKGEEEETSSNQDVWSGLSEKPVFGEENLNRKRYPSDDFFDDIFRGDESSGTTPRKPSREPFSSTPGSRVQSPRIIPYSDPFGGSSLPPVLSLPAELPKEINYLALSTISRSPRRNNEISPNVFGFPSSPSVSTSRFSSEVMLGNDVLRNDMQSLHRQSSLSKEFSRNSVGSSQATKSDKQDAEGKMKKKSNSLDSSGRFHFSIYKWARTEVPVMMPLREGKSSGLTGRVKSEKTMGKFPTAVLQGTELPLRGDNMLAANKPFQWDCENQDDNSVFITNGDRVDPFENVEEVASAKPQSKPLAELVNIFREVPSNLPSQNAEKEISCGFVVSSPAMNKGLSEEGGQKKMPVSKQEVNKPDTNALFSLLKEASAGEGYDKPLEQAKAKEGKVKTLRPITVEGKEKRTPISKKIAEKPEPNTPYCTLNDYLDRQGYDKANEQTRAEVDEGKSVHSFAGDVENSKKGKKQTTKRNILNFTGTNNSSVQDASVNPDDKLVSNKVKGKVKDFVNIFNREPSSKNITNVEAADPSPAIKESTTSTADQPSVSTIKVDLKGKATSTKTRISDISSNVDQILKPDKPHFGAKPVTQKVYRIPSERDGSSASSSGTIHNAEESHYEDLNCTVKELSPNQNIQEQSGQPPEDLQAWDAKIRKWANGKEGNIRSLLSTLQYVLWPESGWKPVPLVDIIEANPVKRAYQKALLCLHPDKLQQKGAAPHQKYIAEKVFDILQEAWTHFNTLSSF